MNANMRTGRFTTTQPLRMRVKLAGLKTTLAGCLLAVLPLCANASSLPGFDTNLERWAKESLAKRMGDMRGSYQAGEKLRMVTERDIRQGPLPLSAERNSEPVVTLAKMFFGSDYVIPEPVVTYEDYFTGDIFPPQMPYAGALLRAGN